MTIVQYLGITLVFILTELLYFRIAQKYGILDVPNHRSAHQHSTIRGIGILFPIAVLGFFVGYGFVYPYFTFGLLLISTVSFVDDIRPLPNRYRLIIQFASVGLLLFEVFQHVGFLGILTGGIMLIVAVGILNAYNFMDGINGITGLYSLLTVVTLLYVNRQISPFIQEELYILLAISLLVFLFFNLRQRAVGFCGDVGSVSIAFIILFGLSMLMLTTGDWKYIFFLSVYGLDTIYTLVFRLLKRENIFKAHKLHFFQLLVHEYQWSHLGVSLLYSFTQLLLNVVVLTFGLGEVLFYLPVAAVLGVMHFFRYRRGVALGQ